MKISRIFIFICLYLFTLKTYSQQPAVDSLESLLKTAKHDTTRINIYLKLCEVCETEDNLKYASLGLKLTDELFLQTTNKTIKKILLNRKGDLYNAIFLYYSEGEQKNAFKAFENEEKALQAYKDAGDKKGVALALRILAECYGEQGNYLKELDYFHQCLVLYEELKNVESIAKTNFSIGSVYFSQKDTNMALTYFEKSLTQFKSLPYDIKYALLLVKVGSLYDCKKNHKKGKALINEGLDLLKKDKDTVNIGRSYSFVGNIFMDTESFDEALAVFKIAHSYGIKSDSSFFDGMYYLMARAYFKKNEFKTSLEYYSKALQIALSQKNEGRMAQVYLGIANCYLKMKIYNEAAVYARKALIIRKKEGLPMGIMYTEKAMFRIDSSLGNSKEALEHYINYIGLRDKLNGDDVRKEAAKQKFKDAYDKEKEQARLQQERKDILVTEEKKNQRIILVSVIIGLFLLLAFLIFILKNLRTTRKQKHIIEEQKEIVEEKHKEITDSINYAERIQRSFLASNELLDQNLKDYFIFFQPKDIVSGDFYWAAKLSNGLFGIVTADSTGHGVPGAIMSILNISSLEKSIELGLCEPSEILNDARKTIIDRLKKDGSAEGGKDGMDCSLISFDFKNEKLVYAAANNPVWVVRESRLIELSPDKMPVGKHDRDNISFSQNTFELKKGDVVYAITDGMPDQFGGPKGKKFMYKKLKELLINNSQLKMNEQKEALKNSFVDWKGKSEQVDDVTILGIRI